MLTKHAVYIERSDKTVEVEVRYDVDYFKTIFLVVMCSLAWRGIQTGVFWPW